MLFLSVTLFTVSAFVLLFGFIGLIYPTALHGVVKLGSRKRNVIASLVAIIVCGIVAVSSPATNADKQIVPLYTVVSDEFAGGTFDASEDNNQKHIRVVTAVTTKEDLNAIVRDIMEKEKVSHLSSVHLFIHGGYDKDKDVYRDFKAHARIAYTRIGLIQTGLNETNTYDITYEPAGKYETME